MDQGTWNRLTPEEQSVVRSLSSGLPKKVAATGMFDGWEFSQKYAVVQDGEEWIISDGSNTLPGIRHNNKKVINALMTDAVQNYER